MNQIIQAASRLAGTVELPGDKSISHRYAMLAALADGESELRHFAASQDCHSTLRCLRGLGVACGVDGDTVRISGRGLHGLCPPSGELDAGNSGTTIRLLSGILAGQAFISSISGDASLRKRPMKRVLEPLRFLGAEASAMPGDVPPLTIRGGRLRGIRYQLPVPSAQVKSCVLLAGLYADSVTAIGETIPTRDHTERALAHFGATVRCHGGWIEVEPQPALRPARLDVPGDLSGAAFFLVAAALVPGADLTIPRVGLNPRRRELLTYLQGAGLDVAVLNEADEAGEPRGDLRVRYSGSLLEHPLPAIGGELTAALIDEIPVLAVLGACVEGGLVIADARELRVKESDRIAAISANLRAMGAAVEERPDGMVIVGGGNLHGSEIETRGDHRIAMAFAVAGLAARGTTQIGEADCADVSFPGFFEQLDSVCCRG
jgi:3-phosphoshikimate 1-carboxyvinyltransferase